MDHIGHGDAESLIRHVHLEIERLARLVRKLHRWGYGHVHVVTDHGFVLLDEQKLPSEVPCDKAWCPVLKERFALVPAQRRRSFDHVTVLAGIRRSASPFLRALPSSKPRSRSRTAARPSGACHPAPVSRGHVAQSKRIALEVVLPTFELQRPAVKVTLRVAAAAVPQHAQMELFAESGRTLST